jgi:hypothetical protein
VVVEKKNPDSHVPILPLHGYARQHRHAARER